MRQNSVYMIYMHFDAQGKFVVKQLSERPFSGTVAEAEGRLLAVARGTSQPAGDLIVEGINFQNIVWKRPHYVTFVIDNPGWKTYWGYNGLGDPIRFLERKPGSTQLYLTDNHTFFDARRVEELGYGDAFRCINYHHRDASTLPVLDGDPRKYCFEIYLESPFATSQNPRTHIVLIVDPDGQNQGPRT